MNKPFRGLLIAWCAASVALAACGGDVLPLGGGGDSGCEPGQYAGTYVCNASPDASPFPAFLDASFPTMGAGTIVFYLRGDKGGKMLLIAAGSKLAMNTMGFMFVGDLSGKLDCTMRSLTGHLSNIMFGTSAFTGMALQDGDLSADYVLRTSSSPPELVNGDLNFTGMNAGFSIPPCSWSAQLLP